MAVNSRNKGATFERKIAKMLTDNLGIRFSRTPQSGAFSTNVKDPRLAGDIYSPDTDFDYVIECKKYKDFNIEDLITGSKQTIKKWYDQIEGEKGDKKGLLIFQRDYGKIMAMIEEYINIPDALHYQNYTITLFDNILKFLKDTE